MPDPACSGQSPRGRQRGETMARFVNEVFGEEGAAADAREEEERQQVAGAVQKAKEMRRQRAATRAAAAAAAGGAEGGSSPPAAPPADAGAAAMRAWQDKLFEGSAVMVDTTGDGQGDTLLLDSTGDGVRDTALPARALDTTGDGVADTVVLTAEGGEGDTRVPLRAPLADGPQMGVSEALAAVRKARQARGASPRGSPQQAG
eukprot:TRINITY_DN52151_c0_g1_i1.p3 TRINITY_DN52151_c0_g1~~TRINITY_DN52151_c0_g1_i1.p3  ORF type:complete len:228 (+),score=79.91 TRINITY_DN52151_c0_g1_i1:76-684(+)